MAIDNEHEIKTSIPSALMEAWKQSISVQMHFNDICMKIRNYYITVVSSLIALTGVIISQLDDPYFLIAGLFFHVSVPLLISIILASWLFYFMDRHWYHRLLMGAVINAAAIEDTLSETMKGVGLTKTISEHSPIDVEKKGFGERVLYVLALLTWSDNKAWKEKKIHSDAKIAIFYKFIAYGFLAILVVVTSSGGIKLDHTPNREIVIEPQTLPEVVAPSNS